MLGAALLLAVPPGGADAQEQRYPRVRAERCDVLAERIGARNVWTSSFSGQRRDIRDWTERISRRGCFRTQADCRAWLYWMQSDWPLLMNFRQCRRGIG